MYRSNNYTAQFYHTLKDKPVSVIKNCGYKVWIWIVCSYIYQIIVLFRVLPYHKRQICINHKNHVPPTNGGEWGHRLAGLPGVPDVNKGVYGAGGQEVGVQAVPVEVSDGAGVGAQGTNAIQGALIPLADFSTLSKLWMKSVWGCTVFDDIWDTEAYKTHFNFYIFFVGYHRAKALLPGILNTIILILWSVLPPSPA